MHTRRDVGVARQIGTYSDAIEVAPGQRWLFSAGTPGLTADGTLPPDITGQAEIAWTHILAMLERASMTVHHLVKVTHCLLARPTSRPTPRRARFLGDARPASMLMVVPALLRPGFLLEVEFCAAAPAR